MARTAALLVAAEGAPRTAALIKKATAGATNKEVEEAAVGRRRIMGKARRSQVVVVEAEEAPGPPRKGRGIRRAAHLRPSDSESDRAESQMA